MRLLFLVNNGKFDADLKPKKKSGQWYIPGFRDAERRHNRTWWK